MISDLILIAKKFSVPSAYGRRDGVRDFFAQYHDGVYIAKDSGAPAGWEGYAVWFGGTGERYAERFMEFIRDGYIVERFLRARVGGLLVFTFRCRLKMRRFGTLGKPYGGASPLDNWWGLKLTMPNGGNVILSKNGSPTEVNLEVSTDAVHWSAWELVGTDYTYALSAGQTLCIRNTSETETYFSIGFNDYYNFVFDNIVDASGSVNSLLCKNEITDIHTSFIFRSLFIRCSTLRSAPKLPSTIAANRAVYYCMFYNCTSLEKAPLLLSKSVGTDVYGYMFYGCSSLNEIRTEMVDISASSCLLNWVDGVAATGDLYCPAELTIPTGESGIPTGWTRHDISELNQ